MRTVGAFFAIFASLSLSSFAQTEQIVNGGFENGFNGWTNYGFGNGETPVSGPVGQQLAHSGGGYLRFGPAQPNISIVAAQTVSLPTNTIYAQFTYWDDPFCPVADGSVFSVSLWTTNLTTQLTNLDQVALGQASQSIGGSNVYTFKSFDLTPFAGMSFVVEFQLDTSSGSGSEYVGLDDVSLQVGTTADIPANDNFTSRTSIAGTNITVRTRNFFATRETGEPFHAGNPGGRSVWWSWTAPVDGIMQLDTSGSDFFNLLAVYTGTNLADLVKVASDSSLSESLPMTAQVKFVVHAGTNYQIAIDGYNNGTGADSGNVVLNAHFAPDTTAPKVTITSPAANTQLFSDTVTFHGTASDNVAVEQVQFRLENVSGTNAYAPVTLGTNQWLVLVTNLVPGPNTIRVRAFDTAGNTSAPVARTIDFVVPANLTLITNGSGGISGIPKPPLLVGHTYTMTAKPNPLNLFSNWTADVFSTNPKLTFVMQSNTTIAVNFVTNVFLAVEGNYAGLFLPTTNDITTSNAGYFNAKVTDKGALSAKLTLPIITASVSAKINLDGSFSNNIARPGGTPIVFTGQVDLNGADQITGQFSADGQTSDLLANRAVYSTKNPSPLSGSEYTVVILPGPDSSQFPKGYGNGTMAVDASGNVKFSGFLGDNAKLTPVKSSISKNGLWPFFATPYGKLGSVLGWFTNDVNNPANPPSGELSWLKLTNNSAKLYPLGFQEDVSTTNSLYIGLNGAPMFTWTNGLAVLMGGNLPQAITNPFTIGANNKVFGSNGMSLTLTATTGAFKGTVKNGGQSLAISGVAHQGLDQGFGVFAGSTESGSVLLIPAQ